jgi:hypothetical protein
MDIIHRPVFYLKHDVSENGFCPDREREREREISSIYWAKLSTFHLKEETECSLRNVVF